MVQPLRKKNNKDTKRGSERTFKDVKMLFAFTQKKYGL